MLKTVFVRTSINLKFGITFEIMNGTNLVIS